MSNFNLSIEFETVADKKGTKTVLKSCTPVTLPCNFKETLGCGICIFEIYCTQASTIERGSE